MTGAVLTAGETMALLDPADDGPPRAGTSYVLRAAGAESNFAVRERGIPVQFDPNYRPALWASPAVAAEAQRPLLGLVDRYLCGIGEASLLFGPGGERELVASMRAAGIERGAVRADSVGALVLTPEDIIELQPPRRDQSVLEEVGAGDARARAGHVIAAHALRGTGDWETLPHLHEVAAELGT